MALTKGLELARELQIKKLEVQLNSLTCVQVLNNNNATIDGDYYHDIIQCRAMLQNEDWEVKVIIHVYREGNRAADWLVNEGVAQLSRVSFIDVIPTALARILMEDVQGVALPRQVPP